jgi:hypothetical protein
MRVSILQLLVISLMLLSSCSTKDDRNNIVYQSFNNELENMRRVVRYSSAELLAELDKKRSDPSTHYKAEIWYAKAGIIRKLTDSTIAYIGHLQEQLKSHIISGKGTEPSEPNDKKALVILNDKQQLLYDKLVAFKNNVLNVDPLITKEFKNNLVLYIGTENETLDMQEGIVHFFEGVATEEAFLLLRHLENNVRLIENKTITFCSEQVGSGENHMGYISTIVGQSSTVIKKGEYVEIIAGVGNFSLSAAPTITIDGESIRINEDGTAHHKLTHNSTPGKKTVKVRIEYIDQEGEKRFAERTIEYLVVE